MSCFSTIAKHVVLSLADSTEWTNIRDSFASPLCGTEKKHACHKKRRQLFFCNREYAHLKKGGRVERRGTQGRQGTVKEY